MEMSSGCVVARRSFKIPLCFDITSVIPAERIKYYYKSLQYNILLIINNIIYSISIFI